jgi:hypothetical protein
MNNKRKSFFIYLPFIILFPQLLFNFDIVINKSPAWIDWVLLWVTIIFILLCGLIGLKSAIKNTKMISKVYLLSSILAAVFAAVIAM